MSKEDNSNPTTTPADSLHEALEDLTPTDRDLLTRHYVHGWSQGELAIQSGTSAKAIESRLARLRVRLRQTLSNKKAC